MARNNFPPKVVRPSQNGPGNAFRHCLDKLELVMGEQHAEVATALNNLALLYYNQSRLDAAEPLYRRSLDIREKL